MKMPENQLFLRKEYLEELKKYKDIPLVKILSGIRRCGKSSILSLYKNLLQKSGIEENQIISISYSDMDFSAVETANEMYQDILQKIPKDKKCYLLLDEVQIIDGWEKVINSLLENKNVDIYVTGSNSKLLSMFSCAT